MSFMYVALFLLKGTRNLLQMPTQSPDISLLKRSHLSTTLSVQAANTLAGTRALLAQRRLRCLSSRARPIQSWSCIPDSYLTITCQRFRVLAREVRWQTGIAHSFEMHIEQLCCLQQQLSHQGAISPCTAWNRTGGNIRSPRCHQEFLRLALQHSPGREGAWTISR